MQKNNNKEYGVIYGDRVSLPSHSNYGKFVLEQLLKFKDKIAMINGATDERITFGEMAQKILNTAASLVRFGVKRGEVVAICSENRIEFMITTIAVIYVGAVTTFINCAYSKDEIIHTTKISKPKYVFLSPDTYSKYYEILSNLGFITKYFVYGKITKEVNTIICFQDLATKHVNSLEAALVDGKSETAIIVYSSGTTGLPKGAKWTHLGLIYSGLQPPPTTRNLMCHSVAPWTNTVGYIVMTAMLLNGNTIVYLQKFNEKMYLQNIETYKIKYLMTVPPLVVLMCKSEIIKKFDVSSVEIIYFGGAPLDPVVISDIKNRFLNLMHVLQGYGMTEATGVVTQENENENKQGGSVGKIVPGIIMKVVDVKSRKTLGPNQIGELCVKGPALFGGYLGNESRDDYDEQEFYKSGDLAYYDDEGYLYIVDRLKELIKYKTWQVPPSELEAVLLQHPTVKDAGVIGIPDLLAGEIPTAFVVRQPGTNFSEKDVIDFVASKVSPWKQLRGGVKFITEIPKNGSGKILRRNLRELLNKPVAKL